MSHNIIAYLICVLAAISASAQNRPSAFTGPLSDDYDDVYRLRYTPQAIQMADSLYDVAIDRQDINAACMFLTIPIEHYVETTDSVSMVQACKRLRDVAKAHDMPEFYYWSYSMECNFDLRNHNAYDVLEVVRKIQEDARENNDEYGIYTSYMVIGDMYRFRNDMGMAKDSYERALKFQQENLPDIDPGLICVYLSEYYRRRSGRTSDDIKHAKDLIELGLSKTKDKYIHTRLLAEKAMTEYVEGDWNEFDKTYAKFEDMVDEIGMYPEFIQLMYRKLVHEGKHSEAMELIQGIPDDYERHIAQYVIYRSQGNFEKALQEYEFANHSLNTIREQERMGDLSEINSRIGNLELENRNRNLEHERNKFISIVTFVILLGVIVFLIAVLLLLRKSKIQSKVLAKRNQQLAEARDQAVASEKLKSAFLQNISHEIRTPLNAVSGFSELLLSEGGEHTEQERETYVEIIRRNVDMLTVIVDNILLISDIESGNFVCEKKEVNVARLCDNALKGVKQRVPAGVLLDRQTNLPEDFVINSDEIRLGQVLNNLLINACKYTTDGMIRLQAIKVGNHKLELAVCDTGPGIPAEKAEEIFQKFYKMDKFHQGAGLGLPICQIITEKLGGHIYLDTSYTNGARLVVELPI